MMYQDPKTQVISKNVYDIIIENIKEAVAITNDGIIQYVNAAFYSMFECTLENTQGQAFSNFVIADKQKSSENCSTNAYYGLGILKKGYTIPLEYEAIQCEENDNIIYIFTDRPDDRTSRNILQKERNFNNAIIEMLPTFFVIVNIDGTIRYTNPYMQKVLGRTLSELQGMDYVDNIVFPEDAAKVKKVMEELVRNKGSLGNQDRIICRNGEIKNIEWYSSPVLDEKGNVDYYFGIGIDITEKTNILDKLSIQLKDAEVLSANLKSVFDNSQDMIWSVDSDFRIQVYNKTLKDFIYRNYGNVVNTGSKISEILPESQVAIWENRYKRVINEGAFYEVYNTFHGNRYLKLYVTPIYKNNELISISMYANDFTEIKLAELELKKSEDRLKEAQRISKTGHWEFDLSKNKLKLSEEMYRILAVKEQEFKVSFVSLLKSVHPEDRAKVQQVHKEFTLNRNDCSLEFRLLHRDGKVKYIKENYHYLSDINENPISYMGAVQDITDLKMIEEEILQLNKELENKVSHRTQELLRANSQLEELNAELEELNAGLEEEMEERFKLENQLNEARNAAERASQYKSEFLANMSHEIRTPLNAVIGFYHLLKNTALSEKQLDYLEKSELSAQNLLNIIDDILDFSKIEANKIELEYTQFSIRKVLHNIDSLMKPKAYEKAIDFIINVEQDVPGVLFGDPFRINQILLNLTNNALKFTNTGGVYITVSVIYKSDEKIHLKIEVKDTGIGMSVEQLARIFSPFSQGDSTVSKKFGGTGLGLSICNSLADLMGGSISAESRHGEGSIFYFCADFQYSNDEFEEDLFTADSTEKLYFTDTRVLLVEDNKINQQLSYEILKEVGINVDTAEDGLEALKLLEKGEKYELILMDLHMPVMNGYDASRRIRVFDQKTPIVAMSADIVKGVSNKAIEAGMNAYISKPFDPARMLKTIKNMISQDKIIESIHGEFATSDINLPVSNGKTSYVHESSLPDHMPGLEINTALLRINSKVDIYLRLLQFFITDHSDFIQDINLALMDNDTELSIRLSHTLKGSAANIGANDLARIAERVQNGLEQQNIKSEIKCDLHLLEQELEKTLKSIQTIINSDKDNVRNVTDTAADSLKVDMVKLLELIEQNDFDAIEMFDKMSIKLEEEYGLAKVSELHKAIVKFHWVEAHEIAKALFI